jgi:hypothetical protein
MKKHSTEREGRNFAPEVLREQAPAERVGPEPAAYLKLEGALGRQMFSDLKRPRPLMDLDASKPPEGEGDVRTPCVMNVTPVLNVGGRDLAEGRWGVRWFVFIRLFHPSRSRSSLLDGLTGTCCRPGQPMHNCGGDICCCTEIWCMPVCANVVLCCTWCTHCPTCFVLDPHAQCFCLTLLSSR